MMSNSENQPTTKKVSLQDLMRQKLEAKKQGQGTSKNSMNAVKDTTKKSQLNKKPNNQRKRMGV
ncbi:hypothetical protein J5Y03_13295 [Bacillus sp. RG28]|uniref:Uncharacterized protein n=1 Tax=Gottfriedia endophytica TaxID=2820819 RepID=A0A940SHF8_9BACI|nr:hypothetical protein [Gottfriedia endophytica]MBP0726152.1 hypothetical protein [Gottfriedia endophytica]